MPVYVVQPADRPVVKLALKICQKVAKAAVTTNRHAELTQGESEAQTLEGYCEENLMRIDDAVGADLEISTGGAMATATALRIYGGRLEKKKGELCELLGEADDEDTRIAELDDQIKKVAKLLRVFKNDPQAELPLDDEPEGTAPSAAADDVAREDAGEDAAGDQTAPYADGDAELWDQGPEAWREGKPS
jgi:hypothetical protein